MDNYQIQLDKNPVTGFAVIDKDLVLAHEKVVESRFSSLKNYLESLKPYIILPSILVCNKTNVIIDGHHRYHALVSLGISEVPVTYLDYASKYIVVDPDEKISKERIVEAGLSGSLLEPKSSFHHIKDHNNNYYPIILLSTIYSVKNEFEQ
ncbi:hypothetical protein MATR_35140 [Marivirga tractuosa]|uniref:Uncharacterized protein n=1 Tax=Marivirga tractuosa (strain ATCC 23168 / DSM 4126 / NBRC 15989 / NCIMB 1408 / VKM B-1430 / H-43) TaxID=643867 RepID=E4TQB7_MARTH|nr:ParB N-terminal domain-containing protein [Marivirga tractuosa]ADR22640.1 hypothetical protein Ftrac_2662 [Marivirga tractuosa DSM 4126]BDD16689.1 hypothetical protein MATR_35140 [Marivirga tractuosa]